MARTREKRASDEPAIRTRQEVLAKLYGVDPRTIRGYKMHGMPIGDDWTPLPETRAWLDARIEKAAAPRDDEGTAVSLRKSQILVNLERRRVERAKADELEGALVRREDIRETWSDIAVRVRQRVLGATVRIARRGFGVPTRAALRDVVDEELRLALTEIGDGRQPPGLDA